MTKVITINRNPGDFVKDTRHLSVEDRGAYQEILDQIVILGQDADPPSLPDDDTAIAAILGWPAAKWRKTKQRLCEGPLRVLERAGGLITQARIVEEIEAARTRINGSSRAGIASGESRRRKRDALRERMLNGGSDERSTDVQTSVQPGGERKSNGSGSTHESLVTSHEEEIASRKSSPSFDGLEALDIVNAALTAFAPNVNADDIDVSLWLRDIKPDPWWIAAVICEGAASLKSARSSKYIGAMLRRKAEEGPDAIPDPRGYVEFMLDPKRVQRTRAMLAGATA